jgi:hypothetical protein
LQCEYQFSHNLIKMKIKLSFITITLLTLLLLPTINYAQAPNLGSTSKFALFTASGAFSNSGATYVRGDIGTNAGAFSGFPPGVLVGQSYISDSTSAVAAADVATAYGDLSAATCGTVLGTTMGSGQTLNAGVYCLGGASTINGNLILDGQADPNALFIIQVGGALSTGTHANVYWQVNGQFDLGDSSVFRGTVIANGSINLLEGSSLEGRALSIPGSVSLHTNKVFFSPDTTGSITGTPIVCETQTGVIYTTPAIYNATGYVWTLPAGASITSGTNTNSITVSFSMGASSGNIAVYGTNACSNGIVSTNYSITVSQLPLTSAIYHQ